MEISRVSVYKVKGKDKLKAFVSVTLGNVFAVNGIRVVEGKDGLFVAMPNRKDKRTEKYLDIAHPINNDFRKELVSKVLEAYESVTSVEETETVAE